MIGLLKLVTGFPLAAPISNAIFRRGKNPLKMEMPSYYFIHLFMLRAPSLVSFQWMNERERSDAINLKSLIDHS